MNQLQIFNNPEFGNVRVVEINGEPWFVGTDVATALKYKDAFGALKKHVDDEDKLVCQINSAGQKRDATVINESGLYSLILRSNLDKAREFKRWVTNDILPAIRKTGMYINPNAPIDTQLLRQLADEIDRQRNKVAVLETQVAQLQPKASYCDLILQCPDLVSTSQIAKDYGFSGKTFNKILHNLKIQFKQGGVWLLYQKYARLGWTSTKTYHFTDIAGQEHCRVHTYWTQKGRLELYELLKQNGYLPTVERAA